MRAIIQTIKQAVKLTEHNCINRLNALLLVGALVGCSAPEISINYYSLNTINEPPKSLITNQNNQNVRSLTQKSIIIQQVEMADFLKTGGIVMQIGAHQLQLSNNHLWADKLPRAISVNLARQLPIHSTKTSTQPIIVDMFFEQFTIAENNQTVVSGFYTVKDQGKSTQEYFDIRQPLTQDGYNHAVESFQSALKQLAEQITQTTVQ
jgi:uncharacterized lipoprotein YmbA